MSTIEEIPCSELKGVGPVCEHGTDGLDGYINHKTPPGGINIFPCKGIAADVEGVLNGDKAATVEKREIMPRKDLIFIVDDSPMLLHVMKMILSPFKGMEIRTFADGQQALDNIQETGELPAVILSDYQMPNVDGMELCNEMKKIDASKKPFVVVVTGKFVGDVYNEFMEAGAFTVIQKPFLSPQDLLKAVETAHYLRTSGNEA